MRSTGALSIYSNYTEFIQNLSTEWRWCCQRFLPNWQVFPSCQAAESYVKPALERANCYPILIKDAWLCSLALNFIFLSLTDKPCCSSLKKAHSSGPASTLSLSRALSLSSPLETAPRQIRCLIGSKLSFFPFFSSFLGFLTWSQWTFMWKIVELWRLHLILLSSSTCGSI